MPKRKDWKKLVLEQSKIDNAEILTEFPDKVNREFRIDFICINCNIEHIKTIRMIIERTGFFCDTCRKTCINWNQLLAEQVIKDNAELLIRIPNRVRREFVIKFKCNCGNLYQKKVHNIIQSTGFFCETCSKNNCNNKKIITSLENWGVEYACQSEEVQEKMKATSLRNWGVENLLISQTIYNSINLRYHNFME